MMTCPRLLAAVVTLGLSASGLSACSVGGNEDDGGRQPDEVDAAATYVVLGPVAGASVQVKTLAGEVVGEGATEAYDEARDTELVGSQRRLKNIDQGRRVGRVRYTRLTLTALADPDLVIVSASGGRDTDANDDGLIASDEGGNGPTLTGTVEALVRVADLRGDGPLFVTPLTSIARAAAADAAGSLVIETRANRLATFLLKSTTDGGDLDTDRSITWRDLGRYDPSRHNFEGSATTRSLDTAFKSASLLNLFLSISDTRSVARQLLEGGAENTPVKIAARLFGDTNANGLANVFEDPATHDVDQDSLTDARDSDTDGDGLPNDIEAGLGLLPWNADTDGNGVKDGQEDFDGDGLDNATELAKSTDPKKADTDDDGLTDKQEIDNGLNPNDSTDGAAADSDADGISNAAEIAHGLNPKDAGDAALDPDYDGLSNFDEIVTHKTDPKKADTDDDGIPDKAEIDNGLNPLDLSDGGTADSDGDGLTNAQEVNYGLNPRDATDADQDADHDGLLSRAEVLTYGTKPKVADTDGDGLSDGQEVMIYHTNPTVADSDGDGLSDGREVILIGSDPLNPDTDGDSISDGAEVNGFLLYDKVTRVSTDPTMTDTDGDGIHDGIEKAVQDRCATYVSPVSAKNFLTGPLHPNNPATKPALGGLTFVDTALTASALEGDPDADGKPTIEELFHGTNPNSAASSFAYAYESTSGGARKVKFTALEDAGLVYVPGGWDVDGDGVSEPGFFIAKYEAKEGATNIVAPVPISPLLAAQRVYDADTQRFTDRLCDNGTAGKDEDTQDAAGECRGNRYQASLIQQAAPRLKTLKFTPTGLPLVGLTWVEAAHVLAESPVDTAGTSGGPYSLQLPTEVQWIQVARTALLNPTNWSGGAVDQGQLYQGHSDNSPAALLPVNDANNPYDRTGNSASSGPSQRRTLTVANGIVARDFDLPLNYAVDVWDLSGNAAEWTAGFIAAQVVTATTPGRPGGDRFAGGLAEFEDYASTNLTGPEGDISSMPAWWKPSKIDNTVFSSSKGIGAYFDGASPSDTDGDGQSNGSSASSQYGYGTGYAEAYSAPLRGGYFASGSYAGVFAASLDNGAGKRASFIGFRATSP